MSYQSISPADLNDLFVTLDTFLSGTPGWTTNKGTGYFAARKTGTGYDIGFAARWDTTTTPSNVGIYQWLGAAYNTVLEPWQQNDDSGNGASSATDANLGLSRHVTITNTPLQAWFFEDDHYFHVVVQTTADTYVHFGAGQLDKFNDWTGGEYVYGQKFNTGATAAQLSRSSTFLLDGRLEAGATGDLLTNAQLYAATIHVEGMAEQTGAEKWMVSMGSAQASGSLGTDRATNPRRHIIGGFREWWFAPNFGRFRATIGRAVVPMYPIVPFQWNRTTNNYTGPLGQMKDVRGINIYNFADEEEVTVGADTWVVFPIYRRSPTTTTATGYTGHSGIAYKKVTT